MNGIEFAKKVREIEHNNSNSFLITLPLLNKKLIFNKLLKFIRYF
jgi:hypothetical protein